MDAGRHDRSSTEITDTHMNACPSTVVSDNPLPFTKLRESATEEQFDEAFHVLYKKGIEDADVVGRICCWMCYRALERNNPIWLVDALQVCEISLPLIVNETRRNTRARWLVSVYLAMAYCKIELNKNPIGELEALTYKELIIAYPVCGVNICRGLVLLSSLLAKNQNLSYAGEIIRDCHVRFRLSVSLMRFEDVHFCAGSELIYMSRAVAISVALLGYCGLPYAGALHPRQVILDIEPYPFFQRALDKVLPDTVK